MTMQTPLSDGERLPAANERREFAFTERDFRRLAVLLKARSGIALNDKKMDLVYARLTGRLRALGLDCFADYVELLDRPDGETEADRAVNALTTNMTRFFREPEHLRHLRDVVLPECLARSGKRPRIRLWSAGCATGEEAYSMAMMLREGLRDAPAADARILATDLDTDVLAVADAARYPAAAGDAVPFGLRNRYLRRIGKSPDAPWEVAAEARALVTVKRLNLIGRWPMKGPFDAIFCRNVMIYFDPPTTAGLLERFSALLMPGGWLYLGHSETVLDGGERLARAGQNTYRRAP